MAQLALRHELVADAVAVSPCHLAFPPSPHGPISPDELVSVAVSLSLSLACSGETATLTDCVADGGVVPICGFLNPEDLARLPGGNWVAVSQVGGPAGAPGSLIAYRASDGRKLDLFPHGDDPEPASASRKSWRGGQGTPDPFG